MADKHPILSIDTTGSVLGVDLRTEDAVLGTVIIDRPRIHASLLVPTIKSLLESSGLSMRDLQAVAVAKGPGSYTGLRIGVSTAKGLAFALNIPLMGIETMEAMAMACADTSSRDPLVTCLSSRRNEVYLQVWNIAGQPVPHSALATYRLDDAAKFLSENFQHKRLTTIGSGSEALIQTVKKSASLIVDDHTSAASTIEGVAKLAIQRFERAMFDDTASFEPFYLNDFVAKKGSSPIEAARNR